MPVHALMLLGAMVQALVPDGDPPAAVLPKPDCTPRAGEVVVCGRGDPDQFRLKPVPERYVEPPVRVGTGLGQGEVAVEAEQRDLPGASAPAAMVRLKLPFGKGAK